MTLKGLLRLAELKHPSASDRFHSSWHSSGSGHSSGWKNKNGASGAAISALALLAFLFFLNTMQQTMMDSTMMEAMSNMETATILLKGSKETNAEEFKRPNKNFDVENDNKFWNTQRLEVDSNSNKHVRV